MTKEERREYMKEYMKTYRVANLEKLRKYSREQGKVYRTRNTNDFYTLYYLKEEHYVGITKRPKLRIKDHKKKNKHVLDFETIATFNTKREALKAEAYMHSIGYVGGNPFIFKKTTK